MQGYRCKYYLPEVLAKFRKLAYYSQAYCDLTVQCYYEVADEKEGADSQDVLDACEDFLPLQATEVLILDGNADGNFVHPAKNRWSCYDEIVAGLIHRACEMGEGLGEIGESQPRGIGRASHQRGGRRGGRLKAIFLLFQLRAFSAPDDEEQPSDRSRIPKTLAAAEKAGVDIYTQCGGKDTIRKQHSLDFPQPVTKCDLRSSSHYGRRVADGYIAFDPHDGDWKKLSENDEAFYVEVEDALDS